MLSTCLNNEGVLFSVNNDGKKIAFNNWVDTDDCIYYFPLATLKDNGFAFIENCNCFVPFESIYLLDEQDRFLLGIPQSYDKAIRLRGEGTLNSDNFKYQIELLSHTPDGQLINYTRSGNIIKTNLGNFLLTENQFKLFNQVDNFNNLNQSEKTTKYNLCKFAEIKQLAIDSGCALDSYLMNENVFIPESIKLKIDRHCDGYTVKPTIDIPESEKFTKTFEKKYNIPNVYVVQNEQGERRRIVLNSEQQENLKPLKERNCLFNKQNDIDLLIDRPTEFFDPDLFDLSEFYSDRVIEIGLYKPKFYPFVCPYKSCWITGATVESRKTGTSRIFISNETELYELRAATEKAKANNLPIVNFQQSNISIEDALHLIEMAEKQLKDPSNPIYSKEKNATKVLIIEENAEDLGFKTENKKIECVNNYTLFSNKFLNERFSLKKHQQEGIAWLQHLYKNNASGCLIADDMGLGKTLQILYFIDWHSRTYPNHKPYLIVAPISLLENWENEYCRFFIDPRLKIARLTTKEIPRKFNKSVINEMQNCDIILTNYDSLRISQLNFCAVNFDIVALDEAQKIKSPGTLVTNAAKALKAKFKIAMTGTPVENSLLDLWCIMDFCVPGLLGNAKSFASQYQNKLKKMDEDIIKLGNEIHNRLGIYFMRRLKIDVANDLPKKIEKKEECEMPTVQKEKYISVIDEYNKGIQPNMLTTIMCMRLVSEHPFLYNDSIYNYDVDSLITNAARLSCTINFLDSIRSKNEKVIIFSERKDTQKMIQRVIFKKYRISAKIINGDTPSISQNNKDGQSKQSRQSAIDEFQSKPGFNIIIMSPIAAGMGLNVTGANHVIHYSRHWNPAKENQATDRAYRIGQTKDVYVYYPMATSNEFKSFDKTLDELLSRKNNLASSTIFPTERIEVKQEELAQMLFSK